MYFIPGVYANWLLFNGCTNFQEPDWSNFRQLEISPVKDIGSDDGGTYCAPLTFDEAEKADFWSVYGRHYDGCAEVITDAETEEDIRAIARILTQRSGLPHCYNY